MKCKRSSKSSRVVLSRILFILYLGAIAFLCLVHPGRLPEVSRFIFGIPTDKVAHFLMFLPFPVLAFLSYNLRSTKVWHTLLFTLIVFTVGFGLAALTEYLQGLTSYRTSERADLVADTIALGCSCLMVFLVDLFCKK